MKAAKKQQRANKQTSAQKTDIKKQIWQDPSILEGIFSDQEWKKFESESPVDAEISEKMYQQIDSSIRHDEQRSIRRQKRSLRAQRFSQYVAAAILLILFSAGLLWKRSGQHEVKNAFAHNSEMQKPNSDSIWTTLSNQDVAAKEFTLPDSSSVKLYAHSSIRYLKNFSAEKRNIHLEGKAYFLVAKDPSRPFSVYTQKTKTTALGTSFTIDEESAQTQTAVELHTGKIVVEAVSNDAPFERIFLKYPGERIALDASMQLLEHTGATKKSPKKKIIDQAEKQNNILQMDKVPLLSVFSSLSTAYNTPIDVSADHIQSILYTGSVDLSQEKLEDVLTVICLINDLRFSKAPDGSYAIYAQENDNNKVENHNNDK